MIDSHKLKKRDVYLNKLVAFRDTEPVKVITGIRRCGKSSLLKLMVEHLKETGISADQIIEMNFEMPVAIAAPATPRPNTLINSGSRKILITQPETEPIIE